MTVQALDRPAGCRPRPRPPRVATQSVFRRYPQFTISPAILVSLLLFWWLACHVFGAPAYVMPAPEEVLRASVRGLARAPWDKAGFWYHAGVTVWEALLGFAIGSMMGAILGFALSHWPLLGKSWYPYIVGFQSLPKVALAPLMVVWFGFGLEGKVFITAVITFFPVLVNTMAGYQAVEPERIELARSCNASEWHLLSKIIFPSCLPFLVCRAWRRIGAGDPRRGGRRVRRGQRGSWHAVDAIRSADGTRADLCRHRAAGRDRLSDESRRGSAGAPLLLLGPAGKRIGSDVTFHSN